MFNNISINLITSVNILLNVAQSVRFETITHKRYNSIEKTASFIQACSTRYFENIEKEMEIFYCNRKSAASEKNWSFKEIKRVCGK